MRLCIILIIPVLFFCSCSNGNRKAEGRQNKTAASVYTASRFRIDDFNEFRRLTVFDPWQNSSGNELVYYLAPHNVPLPDSISETQVVRVPVKRMVCMSTTHIAMLSALDEGGIIVGVSGTGLVYDSLIRAVVASGRIPDVGYESNLDKELIVSLRPDLLMAYGVGVSSAEYLRKLSEMGVKVMYNADYLEEHPLARCEWIKVFGILTGREEKADSLFREVSAAYSSLADMVRSAVKDKPDVLLGAPWEDVWYISPANSYTGRLISDAGGRYLFDDLTEPNSVPYSVEAVFRRATEAAFWFNPGTAESLNDIAVSDQRMTRLPVFASGSVWNNRNRMTPSGGNDYWEGAVVHPDLLLRDIVSILHPELLPDYKQLYFKRLE
ncbi:MAG TPA: ABC transporter substrate-binding protein [Bacteroidales bacterium]|nr:ABC transporter substrate-binding protein [Bacteroidales bacterium]